MKGCRFRYNALWFVRGVKGREGGSSLFLLLRVSHLRSLCWLTPILSAHVNGGGCKWLGWGGGILDSHRFFLCSASSELLATRVNAEKWFTAPLCPSSPFPGWDSSLWNDEGRSETCTARPALVPVRKIVTLSSNRQNVIRNITLFCLWNNEWWSTVDRQIHKQFK